jgi:hypothetical protein
MTFVLGITTRDSVWMLTDRRLSTPSGKTLRDDGIKLMFLESYDGKAILAYAGLGLTPGQTEPSEWMSRVLRGHNLRMEQYLEVLQATAGAQLPKYLTNVNPGHVIVCPAIIAERPRMFTIQVGSQPGQLILRNWVFTQKAQLPPPFVIAGSGAVVFDQDRSWCRDLLHLVYAYNRGRTSPGPVCDRLASLNHKASKAISTVGEECIVAWRLRAGNRLQKHGGGIQAFVGTQRAPSTPHPPEIGWGGRDLKAFEELMLRDLNASIRAFDTGLSSGLYDQFLAGPDRFVSDFEQLPGNPEVGLE